MRSERDECFKEALETYESVTGKKLGVEHQLPWVQDLNGSWSPEPVKSWWEIIGSMMKSKDILDGKRPPRAPGLPNPLQPRVPDMTIQPPKGKPFGLDNKFPGDEWRTTPGRGNGNTQRVDLNDMNKQQGYEQTDDWSLDKDKCKCGETDPEQREEWIPQQSIQEQLVIMPLPHAPAAGAAAVVAEKTVEITVRELPKAASILLGFFGFNQTDPE